MSPVPSNIFKALGDPVRLRLFHLLSLQPELCVCHLTDALQLPQSTVSRHLSQLRHAGLVSTRREGKWMYYRIEGELAEELAGMTARLRDSGMQQDGERLQGMIRHCS